MKFSLITVTFNSGQTIRNTFDSVLKQTYSDFEYILVDGSSKDNTLDLINEYVLKFNERLRWISEKDDGLYDAMNKGISSATGEIVGLINSGDWYEPCAVERMMDTYQKKHFDLFYADLRIWRNGTSMIKHARLRHFLTTRDWNHPTTFIRREIYDKYRYSCNGVYDDWDLIIRIRKAGYKIVILNEVLANFCFGGISNTKSVKAVFSRTKERYSIYRKNGFSRMYFFECVLMEIVKYLAA